MKEKCLNVIVYYKNYNEVRKYIETVISIANGQVDIVVVNNAGDAGLEKLKTKFVDSTNVQFVDYNENVGYLNSLLFTIKRIKNLNEYKYYILSNTDIFYRDKLFFDKLLRKKYNEEIGAIAPSVYATKTKSFSNPHYKQRIPKEKYLRLIRIFHYPQLGKIYLDLAGLKANNKKDKEEKAQYVYTMHGCYMILTRDFTKKIKGYVYGVRMYSEEACVGELLRKYDKKCFFDPDLKITHNESSVTGKIDYKKRFAMWEKSLKYIVREFY